jgi:hypothetical protein
VVRGVKALQMALRGVKALLAAVVVRESVAYLHPKEGL